MKLQISLSQILRGAIIYSAGDTIAQLVLGTFTPVRLLSIVLIGGCIYSVEIPNYFRWIDSKVKNDHLSKKSLYRTVLALLYFNPIWITRHWVMIQLISGNFHPDIWHLLNSGIWSFLINIPISFTANYLIQNKATLKYRFIFSAVFSSLMAIFYALCEVWFK